MDLRIKDSVNNIFGGMKPLEMSEFALLGLMSIVLPYDWQLVMWLLPLLVVNTIVRIVAARHIGNPSLSKGARWALWLMVAFFAYQLVSMLYTVNQADGWDMILRRLPLLLFALCPLVTDSGYLTRGRVRVLMWIFTLSLTVKFIIRFIIMLAESHKFVFAESFDPVHHTYMAMYLMFVIGFLYSEWLNHRKEMSRTVQLLFYLVVLIMLAYLVMVLSRTGIAGLVVMVFAIIAYHIFGLKEVRRGLLMLAAVAVLGTGVYFMLPDSSRRLTQTFEEMSEGDTSDARYLIFGSSLKGISQSLPWGVGIGDKNDVLAKIYEETGEDYAIQAQYNSHNIYLDAMLTMGIPGLLLLLAALAEPTVMAWRRRDFILMSFIFSFAFSGLFEAILNRQMGIMFVGLFWMILLASRIGGALGEDKGKLREVKGS
ncbi:MAG: O-antigen ligase family protein [Bacteroidales bacterium]|nr:O-antigen ligase family protein [Bacteroidales bacterium]